MTYRHFVPYTTCDTVRLCKQQPDDSYQPPNYCLQQVAKLFAAHSNFFHLYLWTMQYFFGGAKNCTSYKSHYLSVHKYRIPYLNRHHPRQDYFHILPIFLWPPLLCCFLWGGSATTNSDDDGKANQCLNYIFLHVHFLFFTLLFLPTDRENKGMDITLNF